MRPSLLLGSALALGGSLSAQCFLETFEHPDAVPGQEFGAAVATDGIHAVVGAPIQDACCGLSGPGSAYVYRREGLSWVLEAVLSGVGDDGDRFGAAVALDADRIAVGAPDEDLPEGFYTEGGAVYVFRLAGGTWVKEARLTAPAPGSKEHLGGSVGLSGGVLVAGEPSQVSHQNEAYIFRFDGTAWAHAQTLKPDPLLTAFGFGQDAAIEDGTLLVGAPGEVYAYEDDGASWTLVDVLPHGASLSDFGTSIALEGDRAVIGRAPFHEAYAYRRQDGKWVEEQVLTHPAVLLEASFFGAAVSLDGDHAYVGAPVEDPDGDVHTGAVFAYVFDGSQWNFSALLTPVVGGTMGFYGDAVAAAGGQLIVGSPLAVDAGSAAGSAYAVAAPESALLAYSDAISVSTGGTQHLALRGRAEDAGAPYFLGGSRSGSCPGVVLGAVVVPVKADGYTLYTLNHPNQPPLQQSFGILDAQGHGQASFKLPPGSSASLAGLTLHHAFVVIDPTTLAVRSASNSVELVLNP